MECSAVSVLPASAVQLHGLGNAGVAARSSPYSVSFPAFAWRLGSTSSCQREAGRRCRVIAMATGDTSTDPTKALTDALKPLQEAWEKTDDKLAVGGLGFAAVIVLWASTALIAVKRSSQGHFGAPLRNNHMKTKAIDKLPLIPNVFEFVGILFSGWFIYRYLLFKPDREELWKKVQDAVSEITGQ